MQWRELNSSYSNRLEALAAMEPHERLGVTTDASQDAIKAAYYRLAKVHHPDGIDPFMSRYHQEVMKLINAAYETLRDRP